MANIHWLDPVDGDFGTGANWMGGTAPGASDTAYLTGSGKAAYTVTASASETVEGIDTSRKATLAITGGTFTATDGTASGVNAGAISVAAGAALVAGGSFQNTGAVTIAGASLQIGAAGAVLTGGGSVTMSDSNRNSITGATIGIQTLTNVDNTISGAGSIGEQEFGGGTHNLTIINQANGVIDGTGSSFALVLESNEVITNDGLIEATGEDATVDIESNLTGSGRLFAGTFSSVYFLGGVAVDGQTFGTAASGRISFGGASVTTHGVIANAGEMSIGKGSNAGFIFDQNTTLTGGGTVQVFGATGLHSRPIIEGTSAAIVLTNVDNTITGFGNVGGGQLTLVNEAAGVIVASKKRLLLIDTGANTIMNEGLIETISRLTQLTVASAIDNTGTLAADGGTLTVSGAVTGAGVGTINGGTLNLASSFTENVSFSGKSGVLELAQSQGYGGSISGFSKTGGTSLDLGDIGFVSPGEATFSGTATSGTLTVTDGSHTALINLTGDYQGVTFTASSDNNGGTVVVASTAAGAHQFIAAAAALGGGAGGSMSVAEEAARPHPPMLARPGTMVA